MKFGIPWSEKEIDILVNSTTIFDSQSALLAAGFTRTQDAIKRKIRRLNHDINTSYDVPISKTYSQPYIDTNYFSYDNIPQEDFICKQPKWHTGSLSLNPNTPTRFIMLNDVHVPHNIDLTNVLQFVRDYRPHYLLLVGDIINNDPFSHWDRNSPLRFKSMPNPKEHYEMCNQVFYDPIREAVGDSCTIVHWIGNHEYWSNRAIEEMPEGKGYWEVENNIRNIDLWVPSKEIANLGKLHFVHGDVIRGGKYHSLKMLNYFRRNIRYGHYHNLEESSYTSPVDVQDRHTARCCGTLEKPNPRFMENRPHDWMACVTYGMVRPDGNFYDHSAIITDNSFMANGKIYG